MSGSGYHHGDLPRALLDAVRARYRDGGPSSVTVRGAARDAGVSHAAAYRHFRSRRDLLAAAATDGMKELASTLEAAVGEAPGPRGAAVVGAVAEAYLRWALGHPGTFRLIFSDELWDKRGLPGLRAASDRASAPLLRALEPVVPDGGERRRLAVAVWAQVHGTALLLLDRQLEQGELRLRDAPDATELLGRAVRALVGGLPLD